MAITAIATGETSDHLARPTAPPDSLIARAAAVDVEVDTLSAAAGQTVTSGNLTVTAGNLVFSAASAKVIPGATSLLFRNNADSSTNLTIADAGAVTIRNGATLTAGNLTFGAAAAKIIPGATSLTFRNNADGADNIAVTDAGAVTVRAAITPTGGVAAAGGFAVSSRNMHTGTQPPATATTGTDTTPSATETYIAEVFVPANCTVTGVAILNGSSVAGNIAVALANSSGAVVASSASTAASGAAAFQRVAFSGTYAAVGPATYYVLLQNNNTGNRFRSHAFGNFGASKKTGETYGTFTTITAPSTFTADLGPIAGLY